MSCLMFVVDEEGTASRFKGAQEVIRAPGLFLRWLTESPLKGRQDG